MNQKNKKKQTALFTLFLAVITFFLLTGCECTKGFYYYQADKAKQKSTDFDSSYFIEAKIESKNLLELHCDNLSPLGTSAYVQPISMDNAILYLNNQVPDSMIFMGQVKNVRSYRSKSNLKTIKRLKLFIVLQKDSAGIKINVPKTYVLKKERNYRFGLH